jgi:hypothetical protein
MMKVITNLLRARHDKTPRPCNPSGLVRYRLVTISVALVLSGLGGTWFGQALRQGNQSDQSDQQDVLFVSPERLDFGEAWEQKRFQWKFPIENRSQEPVHIRNFGKSCSCAEINPNSAVIPAGETQEVVLTLDLSRQRTNKASETGYSFAAEIEPIVEGRSPRQIKGWNVRGWVKHSLRLERQNIDFGQRSECAGAFPTQSVWVTALTPLREIEVRCHSAFLSAKIVNRATASQFELQIGQNGQVPIGQFESEIVLIPKAIEGSKLPESRVAVRGTLLSDVEAIPPAILFGARRQGEDCEETVTLQSLTGQTIALKSLKISGEGLSTKTIIAANDKLINVVLHLKTKLHGSIEEKLQVEIERQDGNTQLLMIPVNYLGLPRIAQ